jgi:molecular chaperone GrpE
MAKKEKSNEQNISNENNDINNVKEEKQEKQENMQEDIVIETKDIKFEELTKENEELKEKVIRNFAEFDNFRKRTLKEKASMYDDGATGVIEKLLPIIDNFERALSIEEIEKNSLYEGIEMVYKQMLNFLKEVKVEEIECLGKEFDTSIHNGVMKVEDEKFGENVVCEVMQKGYTLKGKVIRHSMVKVAN